MKGIFLAFCIDCPAQSIACNHCPVTVTLEHPEIEVKHERRQARTVFTAVFIVSLVALLCLAVILVLTVRLIQTGNNHHNETQILQHQILHVTEEVRQAQTDHDKTLSDIRTLQQQVVGIVEQIPTVKASLVQGQDVLITDLNAIEADVHDLCIHTTGCMG